MPVAAPGLKLVKVKLHVLLCCFWVFSTGEESKVICLPNEADIWGRWHIQEHHIEKCWG
jgi:hypothetical protein